MKVKNINKEKHTPVPKKKKNVVKKREQLKKQLRKESLVTRADSMEVLAEFENLMGKDVGEFYKY